MREDRASSRARAISKPALDLTVDQPDDGVSRHKQVPDVIVRLCHAARIQFNLKFPRDFDSFSLWPR
jgi:hypothetical protein